MKKNTCILCDSKCYEVITQVKDYRYHTTNRKFNLVRCKNCGLVWIYSKQKGKKIKNLYPKDYYGENRRINPLINLSQWLSNMGRAWSVIRYKKRGKLLDLGCGNGDFLWVMKKKKFEVYGVDSSSQACVFACQKLENILNAEIQQCSFPDNYFDVVTLWHVFEHLSSPNVVLKEIHRILKKNGILVLEVPNIESLGFKIFKKYWLHLDVPRHAYHWSPETITMILSKNKFKVFRISRYTFGFLFSWFHSFAFWLNDCNINPMLRRLVLMLSAPFLLALAGFSRILPFKSEILRIYAKIDDEEQKKGLC